MSTEAAEKRVPNVLYYFSVAVGVLGELPIRSEPNALHEFMTGPRSNHLEGMKWPYDTPGRLHGATQITRNQVSKPMGQSVAGGVESTETSLDSTIEECIGRDLKIDLTWNTLNLDFDLKTDVQRVMRVCLSPNALEIAEGGKQPIPSFLFYGVTGTGKSILVKAMAHRFGCTCYDVDLGDVNSKWHGDSER